MVDSHRMSGQESVETRLESLDRRLSAIEVKPRDFWDKFQIVASLLIPASITFVGYVYAQAAKDAELQSSERMATQQQITSQTQTRVGQAQLVSTFMDALLSESPQRQRLAIEAVLVALPEDGPRLVAIVSKDPSRPQTQETARSSLDDRRTRLIRDCFSNDKPTRIQATTELVQGWRSDEKLIPEILAAARANASNHSGIINTLVVLENVDQRLLLARAEEIKQFLDLDTIRSIGPQTQDHIRQVQARLGN